MSYHQAPSPPYQYDAYSPVVSPGALSQDNQHSHHHHQTHTPKRRRIGSDQPPEVDPAGLPIMPADDYFDFSNSPPTDFDQQSPPPMPQSGGSFVPNWEIDFRWEDMQTLPPPPDTSNVHNRLHEVVNRPQFTNYLHYASDSHRQVRQPTDYHTWSMSRMPGPSSMLPYIRPPPGQHSPPQEPPRLNCSISIPSHVPNVVSLPLHRNYVPQTQPPQPIAVPIPPSSIRRRGLITLILSRANAASVEELPEHKRECPACQLEFEPDNYLAVISCCGTAMHAVCLSAWVNSQTYAKTKVCMKCRKPIDARRALNNVVAAVTDKSWDEGVDFDAPPNVGAESKTELDVSGRNEALYRRYAQLRRDPSHYRRRTALLNENDIPPESRAAFQELQREVRRDCDEVRNRYKDARQAWRAAFEQEVRIAQSLVEAKDALQEGLGMTQREVAGLTERLREAKEAQEHRHTIYRALSRELEEVDRRFQSRQMGFLEQTMRR